MQITHQNSSRRLLWNLCWYLLYRPSPRPLHAWRVTLLKLFGATLGPNCHFYADVKIYAPWNLHCEDHVAAGDGVEIYNPAPLHLRSHVILSQGAYICGASRDLDQLTLPLIPHSMSIDPFAWICARAVVGPGVHVGEGAILGLGSVTAEDLAPWTIYSGVPAKKVKSRQRQSLPTQI